MTSGGWAIGADGGGWVYAYQPLIAGSLAFGGALVTVRFIWHQIRLSKQPALDNRAAATEDLEDTLQGLNVFWRSVDLALSRMESGTRLDYAIVTTFASFLPSDDAISRLEEAGRNLTPLERKRWAEIILWLRITRRDWDMRGEDEYVGDRDQQRLWRVRFARTTMTHLLNAVRRFDGDLADIFRDRHRENVHPEPMWQAAHMVLDKWE